MATIERASQGLVLRSGSTALRLDKNASTVTMERKLLFWARKPVERPLSDLVRVTVDANVDRASGVELCSTMLIMRDGSAWALPPTDRKKATETADAVREFLGITGV